MTKDRTRKKEPMSRPAGAIPVGKHWITNLACQPIKSQPGGGCDRFLMRQLFRYTQGYHRQLRGAHFHEHDGSCRGHACRAWRECLEELIIRLSGGESWYSSRGPSYGGERHHILPRAGEEKGSCIFFRNLPPLAPPLALHHFAAHRRDPLDEDVFRWMTMLSEDHQQED